MPAAKKKVARTTKAVIAKGPKSVAVPDFIRLAATGKRLPDSAPVSECAAVVCTKYRNARGLPLMFTSRDLGSHDYAASLKKSEGFDFMGHKDWHQPDGTESSFMLNRAKWPAMDAFYFQGEPGWQWTREPTSDSSCAFLVFLCYGGGDWSARSGSGLVRLCRGVSPRQCLVLGIPVGPGAKARK